MLISTIVAVISTTTIHFFQLSTARSYCEPISSEYFQWLNADGSLNLPMSYVADDPYPSGAFSCNGDWQTLQQSASCEFCPTSYTLVCNNDQPYKIPDPASLPVTNLYLYILSGKGIFFLPPRTFTGLSIKQLIIEDTNLTYIGHETFSGVKSIKSLYLRRNSFYELNHVGTLLEPLPSLKALNLDNNGFQMLLSYKSAGLNSLEYLSLKGNNFNTLDLFFLQNSNLKILDLSYTSFNMSSETMEESGFSLLPYTLVTVNISNAKIPVRVLENMFKLMQKNNITTLNAGCLKSSPRMWTALNPLRNSLKFLSLEGTDMSNSFSYYYNCGNHLKPFDHLLELNLKNCNIQKFRKDDFIIFPNLKVLSLAQNQFYMLDLSIFFTLNSLNFLDLNGNYITQVVYDSNVTFPSLQVMDLSSVNMWYFDDHSSINIFQAFPNLQKLSLCNSNVNCSVIESMQDLHQLTYLDLSAVLPNSYNLLSAIGDLFVALNSALTELYFTRNDFKSSNTDLVNFSSLTSLKTLDLSNNLIRELSQDMLGVSLRTLNLTQNLITTWYSPTIQSESHIKYLDLSYNQVSYVSEAMVHDFYKLEWLDLNNNPLMCHNKVVAMVCADVKNETHNLTMASWQEYKCYDIVSNNYRLFSEPKECDDYYEEVSTIHKKLDDESTTQPSDISPSSQAQFIIRQKNVYSYFGLVILAAVSAVIGCVIYFKWWSIKCYVHRYFTLRKAHLLRKEGPLLAKPDVHYDVFVSYSDVDRSWILDHLIPNMENDGDISLCFHERDFQVGLSILENIVECMDRSHSILLVVSSAFVRSKWCQFEMHLAQYRLIETLRNQLVLVLLEDIPRKSRPQVLHHLMMTKTYLVWPTQHNKEDATELFWKRLKRALKPNYNYIFGV